MRRVRLATSATQLQASATAGRGPLGVSVLTANQASGASPAAAPVSVTATQTAVTPKPESVETAGTTRQDISVTSKNHSVSDCTLFWSLVI